jgi:hypothetical protein
MSEITPLLSRLRPEYRKIFDEQKLLYPNTYEIVEEELRNNYWIGYLTFNTIVSLSLAYRVDTIYHKITDLFDDLE